MDMNGECVEMDINVEFSFYVRARRKNKQFENIKWKFIDLNFIEILYHILSPKKHIHYFTPIIIVVDWN